MPRFLSYLGGLGLSMVVLVPAGVAAEGSFVSIAGTKTQDKSEQDADTSERAVTVFNVSGAFGLVSGFGVGAKYFNYSHDDDLLDNDNLVISGYGPMLSYLHSSGFFINAAYLLSPEKKYKAGGSRVTYSGGNGYVLDIGKLWEIGKSVSAGFQFSQSKTTYKKVKGGGQDGDLHGTWSDSSFYPYLTLAFLF